jgi:ATP-binding cassette subfamily B protein
MGFALMLFPTERFYELEPQTDADQSQMFKYFFSYLRPFLKPSLLFIGTMIMGSLINLIFPFLTQGIVDFGIKNKDIGLVQTLLT